MADRGGGIKTLTTSSLKCKRYGLGRPAPDGTFTVFLELSPSRRGERAEENEE